MQFISILLAHIFVCLLTLLFYPPKGLELTEEDDDEYFDGESDGGERDSIRKRAREARREKRNIISSERHSSNYSSHELSKAAHESSQNPVRGAARSSSPQEHTLHPHQIIDEHGQPSDEGLLPNPPRSHAHESYEYASFVPSMFCIIRNGFPNFHLSICLTHSILCIFFNPKKIPLLTWVI